MYAVRDLTYSRIIINMFTKPMKMQSGNKIVVALALAGFLAMAGCASALFFPSKSAEKAADKVIDEIWLGLETPTANPAPKKS